MPQYLIFVVAFFITWIQAVEFVKNFANLTACLVGIIRINQRAVNELLHPLLHFSLEYIRYLCLHRS